jgi:hypothetical protein
MTLWIAVVVIWRQHPFIIGEFGNDGRRTGCSAHFADLSPMARLPGAATTSTTDFSPAKVRLQGFLPKKRCRSPPRRGLSPAHKALLPCSAASIRAPNSPLPSTATGSSPRRTARSPCWPRLSPYCIRWSNFVAFAGSVSRACEISSGNSPITDGGITDDWIFPRRQGTSAAGAAGEARGRPSRKDPMKACPCDRHFG